MSKQHIEEFGWTAVPRDRSNVPSDKDCDTTTTTVDFDAIWPTTDVVRKATEWVQARLPIETFNHSLRVYCYGTFRPIFPIASLRAHTTSLHHQGHTIVTQHFPLWLSSSSAFLETWALTCLFHDIATIPDMRRTTHMSFEFQGGFTALKELQGFGAPLAQAESVCEAIIRHQDPGETGTISRMGQLVQVATEFGMATHSRCDCRRSCLLTALCSWCR